MSEARSRKLLVIVLKVLASREKGGILLSLRSSRSSRPLLLSPPHLFLELDQILTACVTKAQCLLDLVIKTGGCKIVEENVGNVGGRGTG